MEGSLAHPDPDIRAAAAETLVERKGNRALDTVLQALQDKEARVRTRALYGALEAGVDLPADALITLAINDPSSDVRFLALDALAGNPSVRTIAEQAMNDPNPHVKNKAQEILRWLERPTQPPR